MLSNQILTIIAHQNYTVFHFNSELNLKNKSTFIDIINQHKNSIKNIKKNNSGDNIVLDLTNVNLITANGLRFIVNNFFKEPNISNTYICYTNKSFQSLLKFSGINKLVSTFDSLKKTINHIKKTDSLPKESKQKLNNFNIDKHSIIHFFDEPATNSYDFTTRI